MAKVELYIRTTCPYCIRAMRLLDMRDVGYEKKVVDGDQRLRAEMIERAGGRSTVPQIFIDGRHVGGCDDLMELERSGRLAGMLGAE